MHTSCQVNSACDPWWANGSCQCMVAYLKGQYFFKYKTIWKKSVQKPMGPEFWFLIGLKSTVVFIDTRNLSCRDKPVSGAGCDLGRTYLFFCRASCVFVSLRTGLFGFVCLESKGLVCLHNCWWLAYCMQTLHKSPFSGWKVICYGV